MIIVYSLILIIIGSFLEIYFYFYRFLADGLFWPLSLVIGVGLTALLNSFFVKTKWYWIFFIIPLLFFSITSTSAGQSMSLTKKQIDSVKNVNEYAIELKESKIKRLNERYIKVESIINDSVTDFEKIWEWKNTTKKYENELVELSNEIDQTTLQIISLKNPVVELEEDKNNIYYFYNNLFGISVKWSQFIMQTILSAFIAAMAPIGIILLKKRKKKEEKKKFTLEQIKEWITMTLYPLKSNRGDEIISENAFIEFKKRRGVNYTKEDYSDIKNLALKAGVIDRNNKILIKDEQKAVENIWRIYEKHLRRSKRY